MVRGASCSGLQRPGSALTRMSAGSVSVQDICARSEGPVSADSVEKHPFAGAEYLRLNIARAPFLLGVPQLLRCGKDLG